MNRSWSVFLRCQKRILHNCMRRQRCLLRAVSPNGIVGCLLEKTMPFALRFMVFLRCSFRFAPEFSPSGAVFSRDDILPKSLFGENGVQLSPLEPHGTCRPWGMDSQYSESGPNDRPSMVWAGGSDTRSPVIILQHAVAQGPNSGVLQRRKGRGTSIWAKDFTRLGSSPRPLFLLEPFQLQPRLARNLSASTCNSDFNSKRKHRRASGLICSWVQTLVEHAFHICMANLFCRTSQRMQLDLSPNEWI